jgi:hypothetical protein
MARMKFRPVIDDSEMSQEEREARWELWRMGDLSWKLKGCQVDAYEDITDQTKDVSVVLMSRRTGKSTTALVAQIEVCIQNPLIITKHACPTQKMVKEMIYPALRILFHDAPPEFSLDKLWLASEGKLLFPNGSMITIAGTDGNNADNLRGAYCNIAVADEAGFMDDLDYVIKNILLPMTDTVTGKLILLSTPNYYNPSHEFHTEYVFPYEASGNLVKFTIFDSPMVNDKERAKIIARYPKGIEDPKFRCEYMVEIPKNTETTIVPEFYANKKNIVTEENMTIPPFCDAYVSGDVGVKDLTVYIFGYYNFKEATLYVMDEWVMNGPEMTTEHIANAIKVKEEMHFTYPNGRRLFPLRRVMDNDLKLITDLNRLHGITFMATKKDNKAAQINELKIMFQEGRIKIHPRCKHVIYHTENAQWKKGHIGREFDHLPDSIDGEIKGGHVDALDSLVYMIRNILYNHNPYPETYSVLNEDQHHHTGTAPSNNTGITSMVKSLFGIKRN